MRKFVITRANENMLEVTESAMERNLLEVSPYNHGDLQTFRQMSGVNNIVLAITESENRWAELVAGLVDYR